MKGLITQGGIPMIEVKNVTKKFGRKEVLKGVSFTAEKGQITCLIGINGVGKTTIMQAIMSLIPINSGEILIDGRKLTKDSYEKITFIPDTITMLPQMRIGDAFAFMADFYQSWNQKRAEELLEFFKLEETERISELSKGNTAKVNMLLGLALDVDYLLMDEPFSGIDIFSREEIANVFTSHLIEDRGVIITTHEINDIEHLIDKVVLIDNGVVLQEFNVEEVREKEGKSVMDVMREVYEK
jgi:ABC-2 type transport system ATP-binding protein